MTQEMFYRQLKRWPRMKFSRMQLEQENEVWMLYALDVREPGGGRLFIARYDTLPNAERACSICQRWLDYLQDGEALTADARPENDNFNDLLTWPRLRG